MSVVYKTITANPIKTGGALFYMPGANAIINNDRGSELDDSVLNTLTLLLDQVGRNVFYYTTGDPDPEDPDLADSESYNLNFFYANNSMYIFII